MESDDTFEREQELAAAAEAASIGGPVPQGEGDDAHRPVNEAGGGVSEGFELAEADLIERAGDTVSDHSGQPAPLQHRGEPEPEGDLVTGESGEADQEIKPDEGRS